MRLLTSAFRILCCSLLLPSFAALAAKPKPNATKEKAEFATPAESLSVLPGFKAELLRSAAAGEGSWICMATDSRGRLIVSPQGDDQPLLRITLKSGVIKKI